MRYNRPRRNKFRSNDRGFRRNDSQDSGIHGTSSASKNFQRTFFGRNGLKAEKLLERYNGLAKEALLNGDKILSESYYQHADHFLRVVENQNTIQSNSKSQLNSSSVEQNSEEKIILDDKNNSSNSSNSSNQQSNNTEDI